MNHTEKTEPKSLTVLVVPNFLNWATGTIALKLEACPSQVHMRVCPYGAFLELRKRHGSELYRSVDVLHFMVPHFGLRHGSEAREHTTVVTSINHVESASSIACEPDSDMIMTLCDQQRDEICKLGVSPEKISIVRVAVDSDQFSPARTADRVKIRNSLGFDQQDFVVGFCAMRTSDSSDRKGVGMLQRAMTLAIESIPNVAFLIVGPGWDDVTRATSRMGAKVVHIPYTELHQELADLYRAMDSFWVTATIEGGPMPLLEAMACGVVPVSTRVGIGAEILRDRENCLLVDFDDFQGTVDATATLQQNSQFRDRLAKCGRDTVLQSCTWEQSMNAAEEMYKKAFHQASVCGKRDGIHSSKRRMRELNWDHISLRWIRQCDDLEFARQLRSNGVHIAARMHEWNAISAIPLSYNSFKAAYSLLRYSRSVSCFFSAGFRLRQFAKNYLS